jgi:hypothetical protein
VVFLHLHKGRRRLAGLLRGRVDSLTAQVFHIEPAVKDMLNCRDMVNQCKHRTVNRKVHHVTELAQHF